MGWRHESVLTKNINNALLNTYNKNNHMRQVDDNEWREQHIDHLICQPWPDTNRYLE